MPEGSQSELQGVSTRRVQEIVAHLGIEQLSPASVSRMAKDLDDPVHAFLLRPIEQAIPYLFVDASYYKVREGARYVTKAVLVVAGVREDGYREILGVRITDCENEAFWSGLFEDLKERGLTGVQLVVSDGHTGIQKAAEVAFLGACILANVPGPLHASGSEEYTQERPERSRRMVERGRHMAASRTSRRLLMI
ncbi:MAG: transposase [Candidatus Methanoculleus thermohydrogenotrophicum]|nr:transposase [Candidatus Methanoculleus thermohydrogenotrophicum]